MGNLDKQEGDSSFEKSEFRVVPARLRTHSSPSPRTNLGRVSPEGLEAMFKRTLGPQNSSSFPLNKFGAKKYYHNNDAVFDRGM